MHVRYSTVHVSHSSKTKQYIQYAVCLLMKQDASWEIRLALISLALNQLLL